MEEINIMADIKVFGQPVKTFPQGIGETFHQLMQNNKTDKTKPLVEWYKSEEEMFCMVKSIATP